MFLNLCFIYCSNQDLIVSEQIESLIAQLKERRELYGEELNSSDDIFIKSLIFGENVEDTNHIQQPVKSTNREYKFKVNYSDDFNIRNKILELEKFKEFNFNMSINNLKICNQNDVEMPKILTFKKTKSQYAEFNIKFLDEEKKKLHKKYRKKIYLLLRHLKELCTARLPTLKYKIKQMKIFENTSTYKLISEVYTFLDSFMKQYIIFYESKYLNISNVYDLIELNKMKIELIKRLQKKIYVKLLKNLILEIELNGLSNFLPMKQIVIELRTIKNKIITLQNGYNWYIKSLEGMNNIYYCYS